MSVVVKFRTAAQLTGGRVLLWSLLGRLPNAMSPIGTLLLVSRNTDSVWRGSLVAGALACGQAVGGPLVGRLADRREQRTDADPAVGLLGVAVAPQLITMFGLAERTVPTVRLGEAMAALVSALILAQSAGTFLGGRATTHFGPAAPFAITAGAAASSLLLAACTATEQRYRRRTPTAQTIQTIEAVEAVEAVETAPITPGGHTHDGGGDGGPHTVAPAARPCRPAPTDRQGPTQAGVS
ncbi:hypothetical protein [Kitasatospora sp. NPDC087314]|uniref:hypothetical protein n=1 Tax=Kitasatospora sp. NPDC087314 TaxID=3364068 RepID=UPI003804FB3E